MLFVSNRKILVIRTFEFDRQKRKNNSLLCGTICVIYLMHLRQIGKTSVFKAFLDLILSAAHLRHVAALPQITQQKKTD